MSSDESGPPAPVSDLMALAMIRRVLLELGHDPLAVGPGEAMWSVEAWMRLEQAELGGQTPIQALQTAAGADAVRQSLLARLGPQRAGKK